MLVRFPFDHLFRHGELFAMFGPSMFICPVTTARERQITLATARVRCIRIPIPAYSAHSLLWL